MKLLLTSDLHYYTGNEAVMDGLAQKVCASDADVFIIGGDATSGGSYVMLARLLEKFSGFRGQKLFVAGNHDLWNPHDTGVEKYFELQNFVEQYDFHSLDKNPFVKDGVGFVGSIGWYDYSFKMRSGEIPEQFIMDARTFTRWEDVDDKAYATKMAEATSDKWDFAWNDVNYARIPSDKDFLEQRLNALQRQLEEVSPKVDQIVAMTHHLPFENIVPRDQGNTAFTLGNAYQGSARIGALLQQYGKVGYAFCGHSHVSGQWRNGTITCYNISRESPVLFSLEM